ncbi:UNVERIFIED_CONTAM: hypothetical protein NCL1_57019 [Trichonephila clavipes]
MILNFIQNLFYCPLLMFYGILESLSQDLLVSGRSISDRPNPFPRPLSALTGSGQSKRSQQGSFFFSARTSSAPLFSSSSVLPIFISPFKFFSFLTLCHPINYALLLLILMRRYVPHLGTGTP